jgi:FKBP-type peptidyl-prolyl cis-trans isomerase
MRFRSGFSAGRDSGLIPVWELLPGLAGWFPVWEFALSSHTTPFNLSQETRSMRAPFAALAAVLTVAALGGCKQSSTSNGSAGASGTTSASSSTGASAAGSTPASGTVSTGTAAGAGASAAAALPGESVGAMQQVTTSSGLKYTDIKVGDGAVAETGMVASVHYTGWLMDGTKFDSSLDRGQPLSFKLGGGRVIRGWEEGVKGMRVGGKRKLVIPSDLGYGDAGFPGAIPPRATLVFDVELVGLQP